MTGSQLYVPQSVQRDEPRVPAATRSVSRRALLATGAALSASSLAPVRAADERRAGNKLKVAIFSKHLRFLEGDDLARSAAEIGFDSIDLAVRKGGHVEPARVKQELPWLVSAIRQHGLEVPMLTTDIVDADSPYAEDILRSMSELGIHHYRWGGFRYAPEGSLAAQIDALKPRVAKLASLNSQYRACAMYHTHSGTGLVGASIWDLHILLKNFDPNAVAVNYDIGHATVEGGFGGWINSLRITGPHLRGVAVKDFVWASNGPGKWHPQWTPLGEGMVHFQQFFAMIGDSHFSGPLQLHFEYPLAGADSGQAKLTGDRAVVFHAMKRDLQRLRAYLVETGLA
jgi:sugar phosphate isomerase/epimerase